MLLRIFLEIEDGALASDLPVLHPRAPYSKMR